MNKEDKRVFIENCLNLYCQEFDEEFYEYVFLNGRDIFPKEFIIGVLSLCTEEKSNDLKLNKIFLGKNEN